MQTSTTSQAASSKVKTYVAVGTGGRIPMFTEPIATTHRESSRLLALCDISTVRAEYHADQMEKTHNYGKLPVYKAEDFDRMIEEHKPDCVIVCTTDSLHSEYIIRSVKHGCDVVCEKPITTDDAKCRAILDAVKATNRHVRVTFNYRWSPGVTEVRKCVDAGTIGSVKHVHLEYLLNTRHGADYFRRWHSDKSCSGGLLVHKSTHHFDLVNWITNSVPETVFAQGALNFYGLENALARGDKQYTGYERYTDPASVNDPFRLDMNKYKEMQALYVAAEKESGYIRDRNVFREGITIEDTMSVLVKYRTGILLNYSLNAFCPYEGFRIYITGDKGRIEYEERHASHIISGEGNAALAAQQKNEDHWSRMMVCPLFKEPYEVKIPEAEGGHGGGDPLLQEQIFAAHPPKDPYDRNAGHEQGIASAIIGIAANKSIATGQPVRVADLVDLRPECSHLSELV